MKPTSLNQLLFHPRSSAISFFQPPIEDELGWRNFEAFIHDMEAQLQLQGESLLAKLLVKNKNHFTKIIKSHPKNSHGFFISATMESYICLESLIEPYCIIGNSFHLRPMVEELFVNPEFIVVNISLYDVQVYRGDFKHLEIVQQFEFDQVSKIPNQDHHRLYAPQYMGLVPYKSILALRTIAQKVKEFTQYDSVPVLVTGLEDMKENFLRFYDPGFGVITHLNEDFYENTCVQILEKCKKFKPIVMDYYSAQLKERLKRMAKSRSLISDLGQIIKAAMEGRVVHLVLPTERKLWGRLDFSTGEYEIHKKPQKRPSSVDILNELAEQVMREGGQIRILSPHFFPEDSCVLAILKGQ